MITKQTENQITNNHVQGIYSTIHTTIFSKAHGKI